MSSYRYGAAIQDDLVAGGMLSEPPLDIQSPRVARFPRIDVFASILFIAVAAVRVLAETGLGAFDPIRFVFQIITEAASALSATDAAHRVITLNVIVRSISRSRQAPIKRTVKTRT